MVAKKAKTRGSKKMDASRKKAGSAAKAALRRKLAGLGSGVLSNNIIINGTPFPDLIRGSVTLKNAASVGTALGRLLKIPGAQYKPVELFPKGQPPAIDQIVMKVNGKIR